MIELTSAQRTILKAGIESPETEIRQFMQHIRNPAIQDKLLTSLLRKRLITVRGSESVGTNYKFDKTTEFFISQTGLEALNPPQMEAEMPCKPEAQSATPIAEPQRETKQTIILNLLSREEGASLTELIDATGWKPHSVRGHLSNMRRKQGLQIEGFTNTDGKRGYRIHCK